MAPRVSASIRIGMEGDTQIRTGLDNIRRSGALAFTSISDDAKSASIALDRTTASAEQVALALANAKKKIAADSAPIASSPVLPPADSAAGSQTKPITYSQKAQAAAIIAQIDPIATAEINYAKAIKRADDALSAQLITQHQHTAYLTVAKKALDDTTQSYHNNGKAAGLTGQQLRLIANSTLPDLAQGLLAGQLSFAGLVNQAGQAVQIAGMGPGGFGAAMTSLSAVINPVTLGVAALAAGVLVVGGHMASVEEDMKSFTVTAARLADGQRLNVETLTQSSTALRALGASGKQARSEIQSFIADGLDPSQIVTFGRASQAAADVLETDLTDAAKKVSKAFTGTYSDVKLLDDSLNFLTLAERDAIKAMFDSGDAAGARSRALAIFTEKMNAAATLANGPWKQSFRDLKSGWDGFLDSLARSGPIEAAAQSLAGLTYLGSEFFKQFRSNAAKNEQELIEDLGRARQKVAAAQERRAKFSGGLFGVDPEFDRQVAQAQKGADDIVAALKKIETAKAIANHGTDDPSKSVTGTEQERKQAADLVASVIPHASEINKLTEQRGEVVAALNKKLIDQETATRALVAIDKQLEDARKPKGQGRAEQLARDAEAVRENTRLTLELAQAYAKSSVAAFDQEATLKARTDAIKRGADADKAARDALANALAKQTLEGEKAAASARDQAQALAKITGAVNEGSLASKDAAQSLGLEQATRSSTIALLSVESQHRRTLAQIADAQSSADKKRLIGLVEASENEEAQRKRLVKAIADQTDALKDLTLQQNIAAIQAQADADRDQIKALNDQLDLLYLSNDARAVELAQRQALRQLADKHIATDSPEGRDLVASKTDVAKKQNALTAAQYVKSRTDGLDDQTELSKLELSLLTETQSRRESLLAVAREELAIKRQGLALSDAERAAILAKVAAEADMNTVLARAKAYQEEIRNAQGKVIDDLGAYLSSGKVGFKSFKEFAVQQLKELAAEMLKLSLINPLKNALLKQDNPVSAGGGLLSLFGGKKGNGSTGSLLAAIPGFANGTMDAPGGLSYVHRDELVQLPEHAKVFTATQTRQMLQPQTPIPASVFRPPAQITVAPQVTFNINGNPSEDQKREMQAIATRAGVEAARQAVRIAGEQAPGRVAQYGIYKR